MSKSKDEYYRKKIEQLKREAREFQLHLSIIGLFPGSELWWFANYNIQRPEDYIVGDDDTLFPKTFLSLIDETTYVPMTTVQKKLFAAKIIERSCLYS